jgi:hypothetical protein
MAFQPDLVWVKGSGGSIVAWCWKAAGAANTYNVLEGGTVTSDSTASGAGITAGSNTNGWGVSANRDAGFSIVSYTGTAANATVGHGLSSAPEFWIIKNRDIDYVWCAGVASLGGGKYFDFNTNGKAYASGTPFNSTLPTSSVVHLGTYTGTNGSNNMIMYCFHSVDGYQKVGSYLGNKRTSNSINNGKVEDILYWNAIALAISITEINPIFKQYLYY